MKGLSARQRAKLGYVSPNALHKSVLPTREMSVGFGKQRQRSGTHPSLCSVGQRCAKCSRLTHHCGSAGSPAGGGAAGLSLPSTARPHPLAPPNPEPGTRDAPSCRALAHPSQGTGVGAMQRVAPFSRKERWPEGWSIAWQGLGGHLVTRRSGTRYVHRPFGEGREYKRICVPC